MTINLLAFICIGTIFAGVLLSAALWDKKPSFRYSPIIAALISGSIYSVLQESEMNVALFFKIELGLVVTGYVLYLAIRIQLGR